MTELSPCPFCGSQPELNILYEEDEIDGVVIRCAKCGISKEKLTVEAGANWWNARHAQRALDCEQAMREACDLLAERKHGNNARSPGHNARLILEHALAAPSAATAQMVREQCIKICLEEAEEWDSDNVQTLKNYAGHCANRISEEVAPAVTSTDGCTEGLDAKGAHLAAEAITNYADNNLSMWEACCEDDPIKAKELFEVAKRLRDLLAPAPPSTDSSGAT